MRSVLSFITLTAIFFGSSVSADGNLRERRNRRVLKGGDKKKEQGTGQVQVFPAPDTAPPPPVPAPAPAPVALPVPGSSGPDLAVVGINYEPASVYPLEQCQGVCYGDGNCEGDLVCYKLFQIDPAVPGCTGTPTPGYGYCMDLNDYPPDNGGGSWGSPGMRLKLWWQSNYYWQGETFDRRWCMYCDDYCRVFSCNDPVSRFEFVAATFGAQIKLAGTDRCLTRVRDIGIELQTCNAELTTQWFTGDFNNEQFEIHPYGMPDSCITQTHYPKAGDILYVESCEIARYDTASYWQLY